ncbi:threonine dehydrogenase-like Zn-dependent dehydrogenase [Paraburkholderia sp. Clong3]
MKALVYHGPGKKSLKERPIPELAAPTDAIVKMTRTTICGTDLHILKGDVPSCEPGRILGHEGVGIVQQIGAAVSSFKPVIGCWFRAFRRAASATTAGAACIRIAPRAAGFWATRLMAPRPSTCALRTSRRADAAKDGPSGSHRSRAADYAPLQARRRGRCLRYLQPCRGHACAESDY